MSRIGLVASVTTLVLGTLLVMPADVSAQKKQRDLITREELLESGHKDRDAFGAIQGLRPHFLAPPRGVRSVTLPPAPVVVYLDGMRGDVDVLRTTRASDLLEVRYLEPSKAENEYGITHNGGAILVKTIKSK